jgi:3-methylfumaryl-CoA hydratase
MSIGQQPPGNRPAEPSSDLDDTHDLDNLAEHWRSWVGRTETVSDTVPDRLATELVNVIGAPGFAPGPLALPPGGQWLLFNSFAHAGQIGTDGHPRRGGFLPPITLRRRMWAGGRVQYHAPIEPGLALTRVSEITAVTVKPGRQGPLAFVTVVHEISAGAVPVLREEQDLVYMRIPAEPSPVPADDSPEGPAPDWRTSVLTNEVMLFRYSALTRNSHRIHYDQEYARAEEHYPALVVHGPLTATILQWFAMSCFDGAPLRHFSFRGRSPLFVGRAMEVTATRAGHRALDLVARERGKVAGMTARAEFS